MKKQIALTFITTLVILVSFLGSCYIAIKMVEHENKILAYDQNMGPKSKVTFVTSLYKKDIEVTINVEKDPVHICFQEGCSKIKLLPGKHVIRMHDPANFHWVGNGEVDLVEIRNLDFIPFPIQIL